MFYWFFKAQNGNENAPVILWLQGGKDRGIPRIRVVGRGGRGVNYGYYYFGQNCCVRFNLNFD